MGALPAAAPAAPAIPPLLSAATARLAPGGPARSTVAKMKVLGHRLQLLTGLLLHDVTMAGLQELRFPEEKPLLRGQDATEMEQLAAMLPSVVQHFGFKYVIGIGVGAGAYVLAKFALIFPLVLFL